MATVNPNLIKMEKNATAIIATINVHHSMCQRKNIIGKTARESKINNFGYLAESRQEASGVGILTAIDLLRTH